MNLIKTLQLYTMMLNEVGVSFIISSVIEAKLDSLGLLIDLWFARPNGLKEGEREDGG